MLIQNAAMWSNRKSQPTITLERTDLVDKLFAKTKSKMLTNESCVSVWR